MNRRTGIGLDAHARSIAACAFIPETGEIVQRGFGYDVGSMSDRVPTRLGGKVERMNRTLAQE